jgi:trimethylamine--corrinoid protein Co-methyltransferase
MDDGLWIQPRITVLDQEQMVRIHEQSLRILSAVGVRVDDRQARRLLQSAAARADSDNVVRLPRELVEWALEVAPAHVDIYDRQGKPAFRLGKDRTRFGIGVTTLYYQDPETDEVVPFTRQHMRTIVRLGDALSSFDVVSTVGVLRDVPPEVSDLYAALEMVANTTKPLVLLVSDETCFPNVLDMLEHVRGDLSSRPFTISYVNPISPLVLNRGTTDKLVLAISRGLPVIFSSYGMAGATTPIAPTDALALLNAELLAGLTLVQLVREGAPVILGALPAFFDMRGTGSFYDMHSYLLNLACAEMMDWYRLPHAGTSGSGMGWGPDLLTAAHQWANHLTSCLGKVGLVPFVGDVLGSKAYSPVTMTYANEAIAQARRLAQGFELDDSPGLLEEIASIGPGGNFLTAESTIQRCRTAYYQSSIWQYLTLEEWQSRGCPSAAVQLRDYTKKLLCEIKAPSNCADLVARGESFIRRQSDRWEESN